ncbi:MAG: hypothetical protein H7172_02325 [Ferruginibacter sp.]|nr:hypothetical protein [Rhodoferax sp.]
MDSFILRLQGLRLKNCEAQVMLWAEQYQLLQIDAPVVPPEEMRAAARYQIQELLHTHVDDSTLDVMRVGDGQQKGIGQIFVVAVANTVVREVMALGDAMQWNISVIDIQETAQRNLQSALARLEGHADRANAALVLVSDHLAVLTISANDELFYSRRLELPDGFLAAYWGPASEMADEPAEMPSNFLPLGEYIPDYSVGGVAYGTDYSDTRTTATSTLSNGADIDEKAQRFVAEVNRSLDAWSRIWASMALHGVRVYAGERTNDLLVLLGNGLDHKVQALDVGVLFPGFEAVTGEDAALCLPLLGVLRRTESRKS